MIVVSNSSPLIGLSAIGRIDLLSSLYQDIHIPEAVYQEVVSQGVGRPGETEVNQATWIHRNVADKQKVKQLMAQTGLDLGESEAIVLAQDLNADWLIIDDVKGRSYLQGQGQSIIGILGVLLLAKRNQLISEVRKPMDDLLKAKYYISPNLYKAIIQAAEE